MALQGRFPGEVFPNLKGLLGLAVNEEGIQALDTYSQRYPAVQVEQVKELGTTLVKSSAFVDEEPPWSVEELLAMELAKLLLSPVNANPDPAGVEVPASYRRRVQTVPT